MMKTRSEPMGIPLRITRTSYDEKMRPTTVEFDVVLVSFDEVEIPGFDLEADLAAEELGFEVDSPQLTFYKTYRFHDILNVRAPAIADYLEKHGYDSFNHGNFSREDFAQLLLDSLRRTDAHMIKEKIDILRSFVDFEHPEAAEISPSTYANMLLMLLEFNRGDIPGLIEELRGYVFSEAELVELDDYRDALLKALEKQVKDDGPAIEQLLDELMQYFDADDVDYIVDGPYQADAEWHESQETTEHEINIDSYTVANWTTHLQRRVYDPVWFVSSTMDYCEASEEFCIPDGAERVLTYFGMTEKEPDEPDEPWHPEPDPDGQYGVLYVHYEYKPGVPEHLRSKLLKVIEREVVPYDDESDAKEAIEFSEHVIKYEGGNGPWDMRIVERRSPEEVAYFKQMEKQPALAEWGEYERDPIWSEWKELDEES
jgi:hypothetical protein